MHRQLRIFVPLSTLIFFLICLSGCSDDDPINVGIVTLQNSGTLGDYLVDGNGKTLYFFSKDVGGESRCTGGCLTDWPVYHAPDLKPGSGVDVNDFSTLTRDDGTKQTAYKGWPLYYFIGDNTSGDTNGEALGNVWFVAKPNYSIMLAEAQLVGQDGKNYTSTYQEGSGQTQYFVDAEGRTLYTFINDYKDVNKFTAPDLSNNGFWPIFHTDIDALPSTLNAGDFGEIDVHGNPQLTYKGNPLYYFGEDATPGQTKGVSVPTPGVWPVVSTQTTQAPVQPTVMLTNNATLGNILTDNQGRTLYFFARETKGASACTGDCSKRWPVFYVENVVLPAGGALAEADFGSIGDGLLKQRTYKGRPLYYFSQTNDTVIEPAGQTGGNAFGNVWYVAKPDYSLMVASSQLVGLDGKNYTGAYVEGTSNTRYFTDSSGRTLYIFTNDKKDTNTFTAANFSNDVAWPIFHTTIGHLPTGMNAGDFSEINVHGRLQLTYKGWPIYYFGQDTNKGDNKGISVPVPGKWSVLNGDTAAAPL
jgi:predicted lipoprotein with Yx(FWY)xxD motif